MKSMGLPRAARARQLYPGSAPPIRLDGPPLGVADVLTSKALCHLVQSKNQCRNTSRAAARFIVDVAKRCSGDRNAGVGERVTLGMTHPLRAAKFQVHEHGNVSGV